MVVAKTSSSSSSPCRLCFVHAAVATSICCRSSLPFCRFAVLPLAACVLPLPLPLPLVLPLAACVLPPLVRKIFFYLIFLDKKTAQEKFPSTPQNDQYFVLLAIMDTYMIALIPNDIFVKVYMII